MGRIYLTSYCTYADIVAETGTQLIQATVEALIRSADRKVNVQLGRYGLAPAEDEDELVSASIAYTKALIATRGRMDGTKPNSLSIGGLSMSDNVDNIVRQHEAEAEGLIASYAARVRGSTSLMDGVDRIDSEMPEFRMRGL